MIVAAGGISTGSQIAALLTMGADGVVLGTRFLFTHECAYSAAKKELLLKADLGATVRTLAFDDVNRTNKWPPFHDGRAISNQIMDDFNAGLSLEERLKNFDESAARGDNSRLLVWAGVGAGLTTEIKAASVSLGLFIYLGTVANYLLLRTFCVSCMRKQLRSYEVRQIFCCNRIEYGWYVSNKNCAFFE